MCGHVIASLTTDTCPCILGNFPSSDDVFTPPQSAPPQQQTVEGQFPPLQMLLNHNQLMAIGTTAEFDSTAESAGIFSYGGGSNGYDSPCSLDGGGDMSFMQSGVCSHDGLFVNFMSTHEPTNFYGPVRRAFSAGDLHRMMKKGQQQQQQQQQGRRSTGESELWNESNAIIEGMNRAIRYSPQEKKERIQKYRSKRPLRNFNKRIKYECRKTLADSRPRIKGRFARNDEILEEKNTQFHHVGGEYDDVDTTLASFLDSLSPNSHFLNL